MHSDSTVKMDNVNALLQTDPNLAGLPLTNVNNLSLNNIGEMNMVLGLGRLDLSNMQQQQFNQNQLNQLSQAQLSQAQLNQAQLNQAQLSQMNQAPLGQVQLNQTQYSQINPSQLGQETISGQQPDGLPSSGGLLIQQQQAQTQTANQQLQPGLPGYFLSSNVTPMAGANLRPIVLTDHNNNAINLANLNRAFDRSEQLLGEPLTSRSGLISPSTQSETSTNTQISKKIGIRVGSPEMEFKCWTLPRYVTQPLANQPANVRHTPNTQLIINGGGGGGSYQLTNQAALMRKQLDAQQFASQILYSKSSRLADQDSPLSNSQPDLLIDHPQQSVTPTPANLQQQQQQLYGQYYPLQLNQADLPNYAKFCYETATHKYYTIPGECFFGNDSRIRNSKNALIIWVHWLSSGPKRKILQKLTNHAKLFVFLFRSVGRTAWLHSESDGEEPGRTTT